MQVVVAVGAVAWPTMTPALLTIPRVVLLAGDYY
jgi:hypothetical protein